MDKLKLARLYLALRLLTYFVNKVIAVILFTIIDDDMTKLYLFIASSIYDLFILNEINIKPIKPIFEIKK